jgi:hypothetical protein
MLFKEFAERILMNTFYARRVPNLAIGDWPGQTPDHFGCL